VTASAAPEESNQYTQAAWVAASVEPNQHKQAVRGAAPVEPIQRVPIAPIAAAGEPTRPTRAAEPPVARGRRAVDAPLFSTPVSVPASPKREPSPDAAALWGALKAEVAVCTKCNLHTTRTQTVFGVGDERADWLVIGEAPGAEEDRRGEPFVGRGGQLLDAMLRGIGLKRGENVYIANILKSRPPNNRDPKPEEVAVCLPYLMRQIALIQPRIILAVGRIAAQNILQTDTPIGRLRGKLHHFGELNTPLIVTYHPAYLLRSPGEKRKAWEDLKFARGLYRQLTA
jgi:DNA polymerase